MYFSGIENKDDTLYFCAHLNVIFGFSLMRGGSDVRFKHLVDLSCNRISK